MGKIINLMNELQYLTTSSGVCLGLAYMAERARRCGQFNQFKIRMDYLSHLEEGQITQRINELNEKIKKNGSLLLNDEEKILLSVQPFFSQIVAHHSPSTIQGFLKLSGLPLNQNDVGKIETLIYDADSNDKTISPLNVPESFFIQADNNTNHGDSLQKFLKTILKYSDLSTGLIFNSATHAIHVFYDNENKQWVRTNHDLINYCEDIDALTKDIISCFSKNGLANLVIQPFTDETPERISPLFKELNEISHESLMLISQNLTMNHADSDDNTALHVAALHGLADVVENLMTIDAIEPSKKNEANYTPLVFAIQHNDSKILQALFKNKRVLNELTDNEMLLSNATRYCSAPFYEELLRLYDEHNLSIPENHPNPLLNSIEQSRADLLEILFKSQVVRQLTYNNQIIQILQDDPDIDINKFLMEFGNKTLLHTAIESGNIEFVRMLLKKKNINVNAENKDITTPLISAIRSNAIDCALELIKHPDIDVNRDHPLATAIRENKFKITKHLLDHPGIDVNQLDATQHSPLYLVLDSCMDHDIKTELAFAILSRSENIKPQESEIYFITDFLNDNLQLFYIMHPLIQFINTLENNLNKIMKIPESTKLAIDDTRIAIRKNVNHENLDNLTFLHEQIYSLLECKVKNELCALYPSTQNLLSVNVSEVIGNYYNEFNQAKEESSMRLEQSVFRFFPSIKY